MKDLKTILRDGDPAAEAADAQLSAAHGAAMRRQILNAVGRPDVVRTPWQQPLAVAAMVALTIAAGVIAGRRMAPVEAGSNAPAAATPADGRRQFQFSTPGGTRIIWVFDPEFQVKETVP
jgi:hypothetical protein